MHSATQCETHNRTQCRTVCNGAMHSTDSTDRQTDRVVTVSGKTYDRTARKTFDESQSDQQIRTIKAAILEYLEPKSQPMGQLQRGSYKSQKGRQLPRIVRWAVYRRDRNQVCAICGNSMRGASFDELQIDHIVPWSMGGGHQTSNLRAVHQRCNTARANRPCVTDRPALQIVDRCATCNITNQRPDASVWCLNCERTSLAPADWEVSTSLGLRSENIDTGALNPAVAAVISILKSDTAT